jgi:hypothetical protein
MYQGHKLLESGINQYLTLIVVDIIIIIIVSTTS